MKMVDSPSPPHNNDRRSSRSRSPSTSSRSSAVRNGTSHHSSSSNKEYSGSSSRSKSYGKESLKIVQVANIAPQATKEQMQALFGYVGKIDDIRLYPTIDIGLQLQSKICFVKFYDSSSVGSAQHLTNTVFIDRALIVIPYLDGEVPDETRALELLAGGSLLPGIADPKLPQHVTSQLEGMHPLQVVATKDPRLLEQGLPAYPPLAPTVDSRKIEEIRRTIMVCNISSDLSAHDVMDFFSKAGEVKYLRFCTRDNDPLKFALIEFSEQPAILEALQLNGQHVGGKMIRVYHATQAIIKPQAKTNEAAQKEIEEAMSRQAQNLLTHGLDTTVAPSTKEKRRSRSRSRSHGRRSRSRGRRRSRSSSRRRRSSGSRSRRSRSRDKYRTKAKRSRSRSKERRRSRSARRRSRSKGRSRRSRSHSKPRRSSRSGSRSRKRDDKKKSKKDKDRDKDRDKDKSKDKEHKENGDESDTQQKEKKSKSDRRSKSPKADSKKRRRSRSRSHPRKVRSPSHEKKRSKSKKKKKDNSDREPSVDSLGHSRSNSHERENKRSKKDSPADMDYDDKSDASRSHGDLEEASMIAA